MFSSVSAGGFSSGPDPNARGVSRGGVNNVLNLESLASFRACWLHRSRESTNRGLDGVILGLWRGDALKGKGPQRRPQKRLDRRRLEEVVQAVVRGYCRLQMPLKLALGLRETVAGHGLGALGGSGVPPPVPMHPWVWRRGGGGLRVTVPCGFIRWVVLQLVLGTAVGTPRVITPRANTSNAQRCHFV